MALSARTVLQCPRTMAKMRPMKAWAIGAMVLATAGEARADGPAAQSFPGIPIGPVAAPPPATPTGTVWIVLGSLGLVGGVADLATAPLCRLPAIRSSAQLACVGTSIGVGLGLLAAGIPLVVLGARQRTAWQMGLMVGGASLTRTW